MARVLLVDDDPALREILGNYLRRNDYSVDPVGSSAEGEAMLQIAPPDIVLLDIMMPGSDGWHFLRTLREQSSVPVIMVTAKTAEQDVLQGFTLGADDYVTKPFSFAQLEARIRARLNKSGRSSQENGTRVLAANDLVVDLDTHRVTKGKQLVTLTPTEFRLLAALVETPGKVLSCEQLVARVWGPEYAGAGEYIRRYILHLRRKLEDDPGNPHYIRNERSIGYYFEVGQEASRA